jgi:hypothetical protein
MIHGDGPIIGQGGRTAWPPIASSKPIASSPNETFGGAMVQHVIRTVDPSVPYREVTASGGKVQRAEPIAALYEQGRIRHTGSCVISSPEIDWLYD